MDALETIPSFAEMRTLAKMTPAYMQPNTIPSAVVLTEHLTSMECERIVRYGTLIPPHRFHGCNAETREFPRPMHACVESIWSAMRFANDSFFAFDLYPEPTAYMQTYDKGGDYKRHTDSSPGQSRKLTAVAMLSDTCDYGGGNLVFDVAQKSVVAPSSQGTIIVFPAWMPHFVTPIDYGRRQTINMGLWGPPFK